MTTRELVLDYIRAIETNAPDATIPFLHDDVLLVEHPNKLNPTGMRADRTAILAAAQRGSAAMASQRYDVRQIIVEGDRAAVQTTWTGTLRDGRQMVAEICSIIEVRDGKIWRQEQYDAFV